VPKSSSKCLYIFECCKLSSICSHFLLYFSRILDIMELPCICLAEIQQAYLMPIFRFLLWSIYRLLGLVELPCLGLAQVQQPYNIWRIISVVHFPNFTVISIYRLLGMVELPCLGLAQVQQAYLKAVRQAYGNAQYTRIKINKMWHGGTNFNWS
jgi:hypothetical protein